MRIIKLTESDLEKIITRVLVEQQVENINPKNLKFGDRGDDVKKIQQLLMNKGYLRTSSMVPTGFFGKLTNNALKSFLSGGVPLTATPSFLKTPRPVKPKTQPEKKEVSKSSAVKQTAKCETGTVEVLLPDASLLFDGDKLYWIANGKTIKSWDAVSGLTWKNTPPKDWAEMTKKYTTNREAWAKDKNAGPLPEGTYSVGPLESRSGGQEEIGALEAFWYKLTGQVSDNDSDRQFCKNTILSRISWGNYRAPITPTGGQKMYGRGSFYLHGGSLRGSHGCIDLTDDIEDFAKFFGVWTSTTKKKKIPLTVKYKNPLLNQIIQKLVNLF